MSSARAAVEGAARDAAEVAHARQRDGHEAVEELVHAFLAQGHHAADRIAFADLESGDGLARLGDNGLLPRHLLHVRHGVVEDLLVARRLTHAHVQRDLGDPRHGHGVGNTELLHERRHDFLAVELL